MRTRTNCLATSAIAGSRRATCPSKRLQSSQCSQRKTTNNGLPLACAALRPSCQSVSQGDAVSLALAPPTPLRQYRTTILAATTAIHSSFVLLTAYCSVAAIVPIGRRFCTRPYDAGPCQGSAPPFLINVENMPCDRTFSRASSLPCSWSSFPSSWPTAIRPRIISSRHAAP